MSYFRAPWSTAVKTVSSMVTLILLGVGGLLLSNTNAAFAALPCGILLGSALFTIRGYELRGTDLLVVRLIWSTRVDLRPLKTAWTSPTAMARSWRLFGNGGLFSISGLYRNKTLGNFRAFAMDPSLAVVLELATRKVVITPDLPGSFLESLERRGFETAVSNGRLRESET